jgi:thymidylate synthase (FAD)
MNNGPIIPIIKVLDHGHVIYIDHLGSDTDIVNAARVSYGGQSKGPEADKKLLHYLWKHRHTSPFEMGKIVFNVKMPIFVMRQWVRHRMQNLNEISARYAEVAEEFYIPTEWRKQDATNKQGSVAGMDWGKPWGTQGTINQMLTDKIDLHSQDSYELYKELLENGVAREMARMVLPVNIYTEIRCCMDVRNLLHFLSLRDESHAQWEIQQYAKGLKQIAIELFPWTIEAFDLYK